MVMLNMHRLTLFLCFVKNEKPAKKVDANGKQIEDYWPASKKVCELSNETTVL